MRGALKYGVPIAAGLATGGYALSQGEDPGTAILAGAAGGLGGAAGLLGARLAGKYMAPELAQAAQGFVNSDLTGAIQKQIANLSTGPKGGLRRNAAASMTNIGRNIVNQTKAGNAPVFLGGTVPGSGFERNIQKGIAAATVPASALAAGLGGVALGAIPSSMGVPGFVQNVAVDPESYGSSNSPGARYKAPTLQYLP